VFAVVMLMLNGTIGLCLLLGGLRHHEQTYNLPGARAFLSVVIPLAVFALILPNFTTVAPGPVLSSPQATTIARFLRKSLSTPTSPTAGEASARLSTQ
jgi:Ca2+:H+ antiporter